MEPIWNNRGGRLYQEYPANESEKLDNIIYKVGHNGISFYLQPISREFKFDYKIYSLERDFIDRVKKTYKTIGKGNLGIILNGTKGTGKTVSSKLICNELEQPTIIVGADMSPKKVNNVEVFLNSINQDITIFIDEYEKVFGESNTMLTIMDGAMNSHYRRLFLFTTNKLYIESNLKQRPSRIRYMKTFGNLHPQVVEEIVDDILVYKDLKNDVITFISTLEIVTVDIVKSIVNETNIHQESPSKFAEIFNVEKRVGNYNIYEVLEDGKENLQMSNVQVHPSPNYNEGYEGYHFSIVQRGRDIDIGEVKQVISDDTLIIALFEDESKQKFSGEELVLRVDRSYISNYSYEYYDMETKTMKSGRNKLSSNRAKSTGDFMERVTPKEVKKRIKNDEPISDGMVKEFVNKASELGALSAKRREDESNIDY